MDFIAEFSCISDGILVLHNSDRRSCKTSKITKIHSFLKQCFSLYENKVLQLMSAAWKRLVKRPCFHKMKIVQTLF